MKSHSLPPVWAQLAPLACLIPWLAVSGQELPSNPSIGEHLRQVRPVDRIRGPIDDQARVTREGNLHPMARREFDSGRVAPEMPMERMVLLLQPDTAQQRALDELVAAQHDPESPLYQQWLTPEEFGARFGVSESDTEQVKAWLESHGLAVESVAEGRLSIVFSGTAAALESAFQTEMHSFDVDGEAHMANAGDPQIPAALAGVVAGVVSLHNFHSAPQHQRSRLDSISPAFTSGTAHYLAPDDLATIYNFSSLYGASIDGTGQSIAVLGRTNIKLADVSAFQTRFGLPANPPVIVLNGRDPGIVSTGEEMEAALDVEWSGAVARKASIKFVLSASTATSDGIVLSSQYAVNKNVAPVISLSFGACEAANGVSGTQFWNSLWQQAAAQGISVVVASGDSGAAGCSGASSATATGSTGVNALCSSPYSTCVGGTQFSDTASPSLYWGSVNGSTGASALRYIPETVWNESGLTSGGSGLWAGGGGRSIVFSKPSWQVGPGVPADGWRYVPDVSLTSAAHDGYLVSMEGKYYLVGGTSAATPAFAGLLALVGQKAKARLGNANPALYTLAQKQALGGAAVFHDTTLGNNSVPGLAGYTAGVGYDAASGLGSVDGSVLVNRWSDSAAAVKSFQLSATPTSLSVAVGGNVSTALSLTVSGGFSSAIALSTGALPTGVTAAFSTTSVPAPGSGTVTLKLTSTSSVVAGAYSVTVNASGGGVSQSVVLTLTVTPKCTYAIDPKSATVAAAGGSLSVNLTTGTGCAWTAASPVSWVTLATASGSGAAKINYSVAANSTTAVRTANLTIGGQTLALSQSAASASYTASTASASVPASGGSGSVSVTVSPATTSWTAVSSASWLTITSGATGTGSRTVGYSVTANSSTSARSATLTLGAYVFTVTQSGAAACTYSLSFGTVKSTLTGFSGTIAVTTQSGCTWTAASNVSWISITAGAKSTGSGTVSFQGTSNTTTAQRTGTMTIAGYVVSLTQGPTNLKSAIRTEVNPAP